MLNVFLYGFVVGLGAAAFPGPINLEVVRRAISRGPIFGAMFGFGAVTADLIYVAAASFGAAAFFNALPAWGKAGMALVAAALLVFVGLRALRAKPISQEGGEDAPMLVRADTGARALRLVRSYVTGLSLTLWSPSTVMYWILISVGAAQHFAVASAAVTLPLAAGVGTACSLWVVSVTLVVGSFHRRISPRAVLWVERVAGIALLAFAALSVWEAVRLLLPAA
jgi:threonine/homoserine/homoserine lactone efflux protein